MTRPHVVYISDDCKVYETETDIRIVEPDGKQQIFDKGTFVFSKRDNIDVWRSK